MKTAAYEQFDGRGGNDTIEGRGGYDFAAYNNDPATQSGITVNLAAGTVTGDASVGTDTLRGVEGVRGTQFADTYNAVGFNAGSANAGSLGRLQQFRRPGRQRQHHRQRQHADPVFAGDGGRVVDLAIPRRRHRRGARQADALNRRPRSRRPGPISFGGVNAVMGSMFGDTLLR